jgi:hypothetical protein
MGYRLSLLRAQEYSGKTNKSYKERDDNFDGLFPNKGGMLSASSGWVSFLTIKTDGLTPNTPGKIQGFSVGISEFVVMKKERFDQLRQQWVEQKAFLVRDILKLEPAEFTEVQLRPHSTVFGIKFTLQKKL